MAAWLIVAGAATVASADVVERRGAEGVLEGKVSGLDESGIAIRTATGAEHVVPWDRVRRVRMEQSHPALADRLAVAENLWRARSRVERRDPGLAEPLFERLWADYRGQTHETALVVAEGLLRCRLARGEQAAALLPALEVARLRRAGVVTDSYSMLEPVLDETLQLCPQLPPAWLPSRGLAKLRHDLQAWEDRGDEVVAAMAALYRQSIDPDPVADAAGLPTVDPEHPGVELLRAVILVGAADPQVRQRARSELERPRERRPAWAEIWSQFFLGRSLLRESGMGRQQEGLVALAHVPARAGRAQRFLAGFALGLMIQGLEAQGDTAGGRALRAELARAYPGHAVADTLPPPAPERKETT